METLLEILKYTLPALILLAAVYFLMRDFMKKEERDLSMELKKQSQQVTLPARLQAYERLMLFLERTSPPNLVVRVSNPAMSRRQFHAALLQSVREEFEHNFSQQLYVSEQVWSLVRNAKEEVVKVINMTAPVMAEDATTTDYAGKLVERWMALEQDPVAAAQRQLKKEVALIF